MLVYLTPNDYKLRQISSDRKPGEMIEELCTEIPGISFILFTSNSCKYCKDIYPYFLRVSQIIQGCVFGIMNVDVMNQKIVAMSHRSSTPLQYVPYLMLYINGRPVAQYVPDEENSAHNVELMRSFLVAQTKRLTRQQNDTAGRHHHQNQPRHNDQGVGAGISNTASGESSIPAYSIGIPGNMKSARESRKVCYLDFNSAYKK